MKIVHVLPALTKGGGERVVADLANQQAAAGHCVTIIAALAADPALLQDRLAPQITVLTICPQGSGLKRAYAAAPGWIWARRAWLAEQDVLHCHLSFGSVFGALARTVRQLRRAPRPAVVETYHAVGMAIPPHHRWIHARLAAGRDGLALMARDPWWDRFVEQHPRLLCRVIVNGVDVAPGPVGTAESRREYRRGIGIPGNCTRVVGTVGQLRDDRQPWEFVPLFRRIADAIGPDVHFLIAGEGSARPRVEAAIAEYGLSGRVHLPGLVPSAALPASIMDLYLTLAVGPVVGLAALEAAFVGVPVIAHQLDPHYQRTQADWVWSDADRSALAEEAIRLLRDDGARARLALAQHETVQARFGAATMSEAYMGLYRDAISTLRQTAS